ncbi:MAG TPA: hypothetical protein VFJ91_11610 [Gaiellaceae bacterium]|nr:hypothetical protein [Gaiellaceae bacterium]
MEGTRVIVVSLACAVLVLGAALAFGSTPAGSVAHSCSPPDRQFLQTASSNMSQLAFWSSQLSSGDATPVVVSKQAFSEAQQVAITKPLDPTFGGVRDLLDGMLREYGNAIRAQAHGRSGNAHMRRSWRLAAEIRDQLQAARGPLANLGCDPGPLLGATA